MTDVFDRLPWLRPPELWHPDAPALVADARELTWLVEDDETHGLEIWAFLGAMTQHGVEARVKAANGLSELLHYEESVPGWSVVARCLCRLASAEIPGRYLAAFALMDLVTDARTRGMHREMLPTEWLELDLGRWNDDGRRPFRNEIRRRVAGEQRPPTHWELMSLDRFEDHAIEAERALDAGR